MINQGLKTAIFHLILGLMSVIAFNGLNAQSTDTLDLGEVISIGQRHLSLKKANKIEAIPEYADTLIKTQPLNNEITPYKGQPDFSTSAIQPVRLRVTDPLERYYSSYLLGGFGVYNSPRIEYYFNSQRSKKWNYGASAGHFSGQGGIKNVPSSAWSTNRINAWVNHYFDALRLTVDLDYKQQMNHYYGGEVPSDNTISAESIQQKVNRVGGMVRLKSFKKRKDALNFETGLSFKRVSDKFDTRETHWVFDAVLDKPLSNNLNLNVQAGFDYNINLSNSHSLINSNHSVKPSTEINQSSSIIHIKPTASTEFKGIRASLGLNLNSNENDFYVFPIVRFDYLLKNNSINFFLGLDGKVTRTNFNSLYSINPFVNSASTLKNEVERLNVTAGLNGHFLSRFSYELSYRFTRIDDKALFINDTIYSQANRFNVVYDRLDQQTWSGQINYTANEKLKLGVNAKLFKYTANNEAFAWHLPDFQMTLSSQYRLIQKISVGFDLFFIGQRKVKAYQFGDETQTEFNVNYEVLNSYVDANLKLEYLYSKRLSAFLDFNNLFSVKYEHWYTYQTQPFFALLGVTFAF